jgi:hypothetical protein
MSAARKKQYYNRVRRTCRLHDLEIVFDGAPKNYRAVEIKKNGMTLFADRADGFKPLDINWERLHGELADYGFRGGVK